MEFWVRINSRRSSHELTKKMPRREQTECCCATCFGLHRFNRLGCDKKRNNKEKIPVNTLHSPMSGCCIQSSTLYFGFFHVQTCGGVIRLGRAMSSQRKQTISTGSPYYYISLHATAQQLFRSSHATNSIGFKILGHLASS